jgi:hypothetical protein
MTVKAMICAAAAAGFLAIAAPGAAQAMPANPGLDTATTTSSPGVTKVHWRPYYHRHHRRWHRGWRHHRRCWTVRKTVRWHHGHRVVRKVRRCR